MYKRLKQIRLTLRLTQTDFAKLLNLSRSSISAIEQGKRQVTQKHLNTLKKYNINIDWIITGKGNMFITQTTKDQAITNFINNLFDDNANNTTKKDLIYNLTKLDNQDWQAIQKIINKIKNGD